MNKKLKKLQGLKVKGVEKKGKKKYFAIRENGFFYHFFFAIPLGLHFNDDL